MTALHPSERSPYTSQARALRHFPQWTDSDRSRIADVLADIREEWGAVGFYRIQANTYLGVRSVRHGVTVAYLHVGFVAYHTKETHQPYATAPFRVGLSGRRDVGSRGPRSAELHTPAPCTWCGVIPSLAEPCECGMAA